MSIRQLDRYKSIGWDFDGTLHNHRNSHLFADFIRSTPQKTHFIVTFRSHGLERRIWADLANEKSPLTREDFDGVVNVDDLMWEKYNYAAQLRLQGKQLPDAVAKAETAYQMWKAEQCKHLGLQVLIDDRAEEVLEGCDFHGIDFLHPDDLG